MMLGTKWYPSKIEDEIYSTMEDYFLGLELYDEGLVSAITDFFTNYCDVEWHLNCSEWQNCEGGVCYVSWIEGGHLHTVGFDYKKSEVEYDD